METATGAANIVIRMSRDKANIDDYNFLVTSVDPRNQASFWWGARLLNAYWFRVLTVLAVKGNYPGWGFFNRGGFVFAYDPSLGKYVFRRPSLPLVSVWSTNGGLGVSTTSTSTPWLST